MCCCIFASQLWRFAHDLEIGEMVVLPRKRQKVLAVGRIAGDYVYTPRDYQEPLPHTRKVEWLVKDVPRANFDQDLIRSFNSLLTLSQVRIDNAESRIERVVNVYLGNEQALESTASISSSEDEDDDVGKEDIEQSIDDRIIERIRERFREHRLEYLVARILKAVGYTVLETKPGPDGGVDIVAGR